MEPGIDHAEMGSPTARAPSTLLPRLGVLTLVAAVGALGLPRPLGGDQALFLFTARAMHHGSMLYRDIWDAKQPGIYGFYTVAGVLFGFNEIAVHLLELLVMLGLAVVLQRTLPDLGFSSRAAALAPLLVVLPYYVVSWTWDLGQLEPIIGLPLYLGFWASIRARDSTDHQARWHALAGACAAIVTVFKLIYAPIGLVFLVLTLRREGRGRAVAAWCSGVAAVWAPIFAWVAASGLVHEVWYTWVSFPSTSRREAAQPLSTLTNSARSFGRGFAPIAVLAAIGVWQARRRLERWMIVAIGWILTGLALDLVQFWWRYLYWDLAVPIGLFAVVGARHLVERARVDRRLLVGSVLVFALLGGYALGPQRERFRLSFPDPTATFRDDTTRAELRALEESDYADLTAVLAVLRAPDARPGPIVVFGNPLVQLASGRAQAGRIPGFLANTLGPDEWHEFADQMRATPPAYVYIGQVQSASVQDLLDERGTEVVAILAAAYCPAADLPKGRWLVQCASVPAAVTNGPTG